MDNRVKFHHCNFIMIITIDSPAYFVKDKLINRSNIHNVNVRCGHKLTIPHYHSALFRRSFPDNVAKYFNLLLLPLLKT